MPERANDSDGDLLRRMASGEENAFTELYRRHQSAVYRFALQMSGSRQVAEEVTQDVFMFLIANARRYDPAQGSLGAFLYGVARNHTLRHGDRDRRFGGSLSETEDNVADRTGRGLDAGDRLDQKRQVEAVRKAVLALPRRYREVVVLCELHELDYVEAAAALGCPVGTVRSRLNRARTLLGSKLRPGERCPA